MTLENEIIETFSQNLVYISSDVAHIFTWHMEGQHLYPLHFMSCLAQQGLPHSQKLRLHTHPDSSFTPSLRSAILFPLQGPGFIHLSTQLFSIHWHSALSVHSQLHPPCLQPQLYPFNSTLVCLSSPISSWHIFLQESLSKLGLTHAAFRPGLQPPLWLCKFPMPSLMPLLAVT